VLTVGRVATPAALERFAASAARDARRLVVGALISDGAGRIYVQRRSQERELFPGAWDIVGGHVEAGEALPDALAREVMEETGWVLTGLGAVVEVIDWEAGGIERREVDMLVGVAGDLTTPVLEAGKHSEGRWIGPDAVGLLRESRSPTDRWVHKVVVRAFGLLSGERV